MDSGERYDAEFIVYDGTSCENILRENNWHKNLKDAYERGKNLFGQSGA